MNIDELLLEFKPEENSVKAEYLSYENFFRASDKAIAGRYEELKYLSEKLLVRNPNIKSWLDIACGSGQLLSVLQEKGINAYGIELDHGLSITGSNNGVNILCGEAIDVLQSLVSNNIKFDVISCLHLIEHLEWEQAEKLLSLMEAVLNPKGHIVIVTPNAKDLRVIAGSFYRDPTHIRPYPEELIKYLYFKNNLEPVYIECFNRFFDEEDCLKDIGKITQAKVNVKSAFELIRKLKNK
ncbi:MAG: class I SAM-dependent methyltransferase [Flavobacteriales bacterium]